MDVNDTSTSVSTAEEELRVAQRQAEVSNGVCTPPPLQSRTSQPDVAKPTRVVVAAAAAFGVDMDVGKRKPMQLVHSLCAHLVGSCRDLDFPNVSLGLFTKCTKS